MANQELLSYIKQARAAGQTDEQIKSALLQIGWVEADINKGLGSPGVSSANANPSQKVSNKTILIAVGIVVLIFIAIVIAGIFFGFKNAREKAQERTEEKVESLNSSILSQTPADEKSEDVSVKDEETTNDDSKGMKSPADNGENQSLLANTFSNDSIGFSIVYPVGWKYEKSIGSKYGEYKVEFWATDASNEVKVRIENMGTSSLSAEKRAEVFMTFVQMTAKLSPGGKIYEEKTFTYKFDDGETLTGKQSKVEYDWTGGKHYKEWVIFLPYKDIDYMFDFKGPIDEYNASLAKAIDMLNSWKITKK